MLFSGKKQTGPMLLAERSYRKLFPVQALAVALPSINVLLGNAVISRFIGPDALAAVGFAAPLVSLVSAFGNIIAGGTQIFCGRMLGKGDRDGLGKVFSTAVFLAFLFGIVLSLAGVFFAEPISRLLGADARILSKTARYVRGYAPGFLFSILFMGILTFLQLDGAEKLATISICTMLVANVGGQLLNTLVIHGGIDGAGLVNAAANIIAVLVCLPHFLGKSKLFRFRIRDISKDALRQLFILGLPSAFSFLTIMLRDRIINPLVFGVSGSEGLAAATIAFNIATAIGCAVQGGNVGAGGILAGIFIGEGDSDSLRELPRMMSRLSAPFYIGAYILVFLFAKPVALFFGATEKYLTLYVWCIRILNLWFFTNIFSTPPVCMARAFGKTFVAALFNAFSCCIFSVAVSVPLISPLGAIGSTVGVWGAELLMFPLYILIYRIEAKQFPKSIYHLVYIPKKMYISSDKRLSETIYTQEDAVDASGKVVAFCKEKGFSAKIAYYCGLCVEEIAVDTVKNRLADTKDAQIDLRVVCTEEGVRLILRDNAPHFDPAEWLSLCKPEDESRSVGIRMVFDLAKSVTYSHTVGMNVLTIEL